MSETTISVAGYLLFTGERKCWTLRELRGRLPRIGDLSPRPARRSPLILAGQVSAFLTVPGTCYPGSLGQLLEGFVCTFLDSLRPHRPEGCRAWRKAMNHWLHWPREMIWDVDEEFEVGPAEIFGVLRLLSRSFEGEVTRAVLGQREMVLESLASSKYEEGPWPRVMQLGDEEA